LNLFSGDRQITQIAFPSRRDRAPRTSKIRSVYFYILKKLPPALPQAGDESLCDFASLVGEIRPDFTASLKIGLFNLIHPEITGVEIAFVALGLWK
jgi:hypothetical protein